MYCIVTTHVLPIIGICLSNLMYLSIIQNVGKVWGRDRELVINVLKAWSRGRQLPTPASTLNPWVVVGGFLRCLGCVLYSTLPTVRDPYIFCAEFPGMVGCLWALFRVHAMALKSAQPGSVRLELYRQIELAVCGSLAFWVLLFGASAIIFDGNFAQPPLVAFGTLFSAGVMYIAPALAFANAVRTRSADAFYLPNVAATVLNSLLWGGYGAFGIGDIYIVAPCVAGLVVCIAQLVLLAAFRKGAGRRYAVHPTGIAEEGVGSDAYLAGIAEKGVDSDAHGPAGVRPMVFSLDRGRACCPGARLGSTAGGSLKLALLAGEERLGRSGQSRRGRRRRKGLGGRRNCKDSPRGNDASKQSLIVSAQ